MACTPRGPRDRGCPDTGKEHKVMQAVRTPSVPPRDWSTRMWHFVRACTAYPYAFVRLWDGD
ncbi:hypothetical protein [Komagataeibacter swingsii]|uniref:Uncharacterized protein n=1 Tax=Komagataeibacter swingsii TaxID=215220 RepID=A0A850P3J7_9PROT|nr:hypothetical protein [Komagataeibacter swingsii]NVN37210.1 hypothetical protein [Komagataeibacter swingsii]